MAARATRNEFSDLYQLSICSALATFTNCEHCPRVSEEGNKKEREKEREREREREAIMPKERAAKRSREHAQRTQQGGQIIMRYTKYIIHTHTKLFHEAIMVIYNLFVSY
jgi:3'-phosphoadenosine 5'-phosphosulfate sulfotransferase (PAPS reductase)/FAD synthetase